MKIKFGELCSEKVFENNSQKGTFRECSSKMEQTRTRGSFSVLLYFGFANYIGNISKERVFIDTIPIFLDEN